MATSPITEPWRVADVTFVEIEIRNPSDRQLRVEFGCGLRLAIASGLSDPETIASLTPARIAVIRHGKSAAD